MQKDIAAKRLMEHPDVAADIINGNIYDGKQIVKPENLKIISPVSSMKDRKGKLWENTRDILAEDYRCGRRYLIWGIENQSDIDNTMPLRVMGSDYGEYHRQVRRLIAENKRQNNPAYLKRIHDDQKLVPTVTIVLYYGKEWTGPRDLYDMFDKDDLKFLKPYLSNYKMNLVELRKDKEFYKKLHSDFRLIARYLALKDDEKALMEFMEKDKQEIQHVEEFFDMLGSLGNEKIYKNIKATVFAQKEEGAVNMCLAADGFRREGRIEVQVEIVLEFLKNVGEISKDLQERISGERDLDVLGRWVRKAAKVSSIEEFEKSMNE